jgi:hypothetical protein
MLQLVADVQPENQLPLRTKEHHMPYVNIHGVNLYYSNSNFDFTGDSRLLMEADFA